MTLSSVERTNIVKLTVALFNAAPGASGLSDFTTFYENNGRDLFKLANNLANNTIFKSLYPNTQTASDFATALLSTYGLQANTDANAFVTSRLNSGESKGQIAYEAAIAVNNTTAGGEWLNARNLLNNKTLVAENYSTALSGQSVTIGVLQGVLGQVTSDPASVTAANLANLGNASPTLTLTTGVDSIQSNFAGATITAPLADNTNTFQSGDKVVGTGAGNVLNLDLGNSANFAILATTTGVQTVNVTAEANAKAAGDFNNLGYGSATNNVASLPVQINALRMANVTNWGDVQSRADVVIENIQLPNGNTSSDVTKAVTFTMRDTQPGNINGFSANGNAATVGPSFRAYFDPQALKSVGASSTTFVTIQAGNSAAGLTAAQFTAQPQGNNPYTGFNILRDGKLISIGFSAVDVTALQAGGTQALFLAAIADAVTAYNASNSTNIVVTASPTPYVYSSADVPAVTRSVTAYSLTEAGHSLTQNPFPGAGWTAANGLPSTNGNAATIIAGTNTVAGLLIESNLVLDNVGQGGYPQLQTYSGSTEGSGGDVIIGSMATSGGVQQFNVNVQRTSWTNSLQTTNNVLQVVNIVSDPTLSPTIGGQGLAIGKEIVFGSANMIDWAIPGQLVGTNGLRDVKTINAIYATGFNGSLQVGATIDNQAFAKYLQNANGIVDFSITLGNQSNGVTVPGITAPNNTVGVTVPVDNAPFNSVNLVIDNSVMASGNFRETITGGTGNDIIVVQVNSGGSTGLAGNGAWVTNTTQLGNLKIDAGLGNNVVEFLGGGSALITGSTGNDSYYLNNAGVTARGNVAPNAGTLQKAAFVSNASANAINATVVPTAVESLLGTPGVNAKSDISWVNYAANTNGSTITEKVSVINTDLQGVVVSNLQAAGASALATTVIASDVYKAYQDYAANGGSAASAGGHATANTFGGGIIVWYDVSTGAPVARAPGASTAATDIMYETFTTVGGNTVTVQIGNEYVISQSAQQAVSGLDTFTLRTVGPTSWSLSSTNDAPGSQQGTSSPSLTGPFVNGAPNGTEQLNVTWTGLFGVGATESIAGITVSTTDGTVNLTSYQVAAAVAAGNGTHGKITVTGVGGVSGAQAPVATGWTPVNPYTPLLAAPGSTETVNGITITNNTTNALTAAQVADAVAGTVNPLITVTVAQTPAQTSASGMELLNYGTANATFPGPLPLVGTATNGTTQGLLNATVSLDAHGNLTTNGANQVGAAPYKFIGSGETVTVTFQGKVVTATITASSTDANASYTSTDVNNAILQAVNADPVMNKLLHATQGSASQSVILNSLIDGIHTAGTSGSPAITFKNIGTPAVVTGTASGAYTATMAAADNLALSQYKTVQQASGDGVTTGNGGLVGGDSSLNNNSTITDTGGNNVISLSSNITNTQVINGVSYTGSYNTVVLTGTGSSIISNYKVGLDKINTVTTHEVFLNAVNDTFQLHYSSVGLDVTAANLSTGLNPMTAASGVYVGSSLATATLVSGANTGAGILVIENALTNTTSVYYEANVAALTTTAANLQAVLVGVAPTPASIHLI